MNRAEKRQKERQLQKKYHLSQKEIQQLKDDATEKAFDKVFGCLYALPLIILKRKYGFGKKRLQNFNDKLTDLLKDIERDKADLETILKIMEGYDIRFKNKIEREDT